MEMRQPKSGKLLKPRKTLALKLNCSIPALPRDWCCMKDDQHRFLTLLGQLPVRLTAEQAGWVLNCQPHDIPALISARLLKPLGNPAQNSTKYFATADVLEITKDRAWLVKVSNTICQHWQKQNARKKDHAFNGVVDGHTSLAAAS
jgi:hypothetical protein